MGDLGALKTQRETPRMRPDNQLGGRAVDGFWTYRTLDISSIHGTEPDVGSQMKAIVYIMDFLSEENTGDWIPVLHKALYSIRTLRFFLFFLSTTGIIPQVPRQRL